MNQIAQTPEAASNSIHVCTWVLAAINPKAYQTIIFFGHRIVKVEPIAKNEIKVHTQCSSPLPESTPLTERTSIERCKGKGELTFKMTKDSLDLIAGEFEHTPACQHKFTLLDTPQPLIGKVCLEPIKSRRVNKLQETLLDKLLHIQRQFVYQGYLERNLGFKGNNISPEQQAARINVDKLSAAINTFSKIFNPR